MTLGGWIFMGASWAVILGVFLYSLIRSLRQKDQSEGDQG